MSEKIFLPNFFILGSAKCGTTTLYEVLKRHPDIYFSLVKEPQFFCNDNLYAKGLKFYSKTYFSGSCEYKVVGDATPHYMYYEKVFKRIAKDIPVENQRFIIILRNPVKRAYSLYWNMVKEGVEDLCFSDAIEAECERSKDQSIEKTGTLRYIYLDSGLFAKQIDILLKYFSNEKLLILFQEDLHSNPENVFDDIFKFLDISKVDILTSSKSTHNEAAMPKFKPLHMFLRGNSGMKKLVGTFFPYKLKYLIVDKLIDMNMKPEKYPEMEQEIEKSLKEYFLKDISRLEIITGRNLEHWK